MLRGFGAVSCVLAIAIGCSADGERQDSNAQSPETCAECIALVGGKLFTGSGAIEATLVIRDDRILKVLPPAQAVQAGTTIDVSGRTLLPGFSDLHVHLRDPAGPWGFATPSFPYLEQHLKSLLRAGVTTVLDIGSDRDVIFALRDRVAAGELIAPDVLAVGSMVTVSGGHPCYAGNPLGRVCVAVDSPSDVVKVEEQLLPRAPDAIKVVLSPPSLLPTLSLDSISAVVDLATTHDIFVFAHVATAENALSAANAGVRALAHIPMLDELSASDAALLAEQGVSVIPTLAVEDSQWVLSTGGDAYSDPTLVDDVPAEVLEALRQKAASPDPSYKQEQQTARRKRAIDNVRRAFEAGVRIAAGTDAGIAGSLHGRALHRELELYVEAGMTPIEALRSATENPAELLGLADRGKLAEGMLADIVVVVGDPTSDISAVRHVERVFRKGIELVPADLSILGSKSLRRTLRSGLAAGELCSFADECESGMICDVTNARCVPTCTFPTSGSCPTGSACFPMAAYTGQDFCVIGDGCNALAQSCDNGAACVFVGNGSTHCWPASSAVDGQPCVSGSCAPGHQCDPNAAVCRQICDPGAPSCPSCLDMSSFAGFEVGVCH